MDRSLYSFPGAKSEALSFFFTEACKPGQTRALPDFMSMFSSTPIKNRYNSPLCKDHHFSGTWTWSFADIRSQV